MTTLRKRKDCSQFLSAGITTCRTNCFKKYGNNSENIVYDKL